MESETELGVEHEIRIHYEIRVPSPAHLCEHGDRVEAVARLEERAQGRARLRPRALRRGLVPREPVARGARGLRWDAVRVSGALQWMAAAKHVFARH